MSTKDVNGYRTDIKIGMIVESCNLHIGEVVECDPIKDFCHIKSMFDGNIYNCSLYHCGVFELTTEEIEIRMAAHKFGGMPVIVVLYEQSLPEHLR